MNMQTSPRKSQRPRVVRTSGLAPAILPAHRDEAPMAEPAPRSGAGEAVRGAGAYWLTTSGASGQVQLKRLPNWTDTQRPRAELRLQISRAALSQAASRAAMRDRAPSTGLGGALHAVLAALQAQGAPDAQDQGLAAEVLAALCESLIGSADTGAVALIQKGGLAPWQRKRVEQVTGDQIDGPVLIEDLARACRLSASHFRRAFRLSMGTSPNRWLMDRRIARAKDLLRDPGQTIVAIALECGFGDQSHFTRVFGRVEGISPGRWRRLNHAVPAEVARLQ
ncbi:helix-turn-helix domain-containing protein [bacterium]|nr:helix-turn-helix domain-containing protein [bacterium]